MIVESPFCLLYCSLSRRPVLLEPILQSLPSILRLFLAVARTIIGMKAVRRFRIKNNLGPAARILQRLAHLLHCVVGNASICAAIKSEHGRLQGSNDIDWMLRGQFICGTNQPSVPRHTRFQPWHRCRIEPDDSPSPAKAGNAEPRDIAFPGLLGHGDSRVQSRHYLRVRDLGHHLRPYLFDILQLRYISLPRVKLRSNRKVAQLGKTPANILDMLMNAEYFLDYQNYGKRSV